MLFAVYRRGYVFQSSRSADDCNAPPFGVDDRDGNAHFGCCEMRYNNVSDKAQIGADPINDDRQDSRHSLSKRLSSLQNRCVVEIVPYWH